MNSKTCILMARQFLFFICFVAGLSLTVKSGRADEKRAASLFKDKCASCHGAQGQGVADGYEKPLRGKKSFAELVKLIEETMPEESPEECVGEEARQVAEYLYKKFYVRGLGTDQDRKLSRLTVDQYRNAIADVIGRFAPSDTPVEPFRRRRRTRRPESLIVKRPPEPLGPGLRGEYYQSKGMSKADTLALYRLDARINFDFGQGSPGANITADQFSGIWKGGLIVEDTGHYEFRVRTQNGARFYLNLDPQQGLRKLRDDSSATGQTALIDAWVGSGEMREKSKRVFLLGGRIYPIRLEFFKYKEKTASVRLEWKPPHGTWSVLDHNHMTTLRPARVYVCETPFPADDRSLGFERGSSVSHEWQLATTNAAMAAAAEIVERLPLLAKLTDNTIDRNKKIKDFVLSFAGVAFRRPLSESEKKRLVEVALADETNLESGVRRAVVMILMSPHFLYIDLTPTGRTPSPYTIAARLSFGLWDSIPDQELSDAAKNGRLESKDQIEAQALRMLSDKRTKAKMRSFFKHWLELEERDLAKDKQLFPEFDETVIADLRRSLMLFIERVVWSTESDYRQLLLANYLVLNENLHRLYQPNSIDYDVSPSKISANSLSTPEDSFAADFMPVVFPAGRRSGVLTHPYLLSVFAYHNNTSPIHRGVFLTRNIVGRDLNPPPMAVAFKDDEFSPTLTMREKITQLTRDTACMSCHSVINPLGFTLENFDAVGRWRMTENNRQVHTKSKYTTVLGETIEVAGARDVANYAVSSESAHRAFIAQVFRHIVKQDPYSFGPDLIEQLRARFAAEDFNVQKLWAGIAMIAAVHNHAVTPTSTKK